MPPLIPAPGTVAGTLLAMTAGPWPTTAEESERWLREHGIDPHTATEREPRDTGRNWDRAAMKDWGETDAGWSTFRDEFVGASWFLWRGAPSQEVMTAARTLATLLTQSYGGPTEAIEHGGTWLWLLPEHVVDMYAYDGLPRPDGYPAGQACVQLHLDHRERSQAQEEVARARHTREPGRGDQ